MSSTEVMSELKERLTTNALKIARDGFGVRLDFSNASIDKVESILGQIHGEYQRTQNDEGLRGVAVSFAAYVISVIEKISTPGVWKRDHETIGPETFPYEWNGTTIFPYGWCLKRVLDGEPDNVAVKYRALVLEKLAPTDAGSTAESRKKWWQFWR